MKFFGYLDDLALAIWNWQVSLPWYYCVPLSIIEICAVIGFIISMINRERYRI